jgi:hypothetical protein
MAMGKIEEGIEQLRRATALAETANPDERADAYFALAKALLVTGKPRQARKAEAQGQRILLDAGIDRAAVSELHRPGSLR